MNLPLSGHVLGQSGLGAGLRLGGLLDVMAAPVIALLADGSIIYANQAAENMFQRSRAILEKSSLHAVLHSDNSLHDLVRRCALNGEAIAARDVVLAGPAMASHLVDASLSLTEDRSAVCVLLWARSPTRERAAMLMERAGDRSMAAMGRTLAHEIKNPLAGIRGAAQLMLRDAVDGNEALLDLIVLETDRVSRLVERMESFGDDAPLAFESLNIHVLLERVAVMAENGFASQMRVRRDFDPSLPQIDADHDQLIQVFLNLVKNAAEAAADKGEAGEISISSAYIHGMRMRVGNGIQRDLPIEISIADNGTGIPQEMIDSLFEPFLTTKVSGTGLGLPLVRKIVTAHGGLIDFDSQPGKTIFRVRLPLRATPLTQTDMGQGDHGPPDGS